jgi:hypothetical protein
MLSHVGGVVESMSYLLLPPGCAFFFLFFFVLVTESCKNLLVNFIVTVRPCETTGVLAGRIFIKFDTGERGICEHSPV